MTLAALLQGPLGDFLYAVGFWVEYCLVRSGRSLCAALRWGRRTLGGLLAAALRPAVRLLADLAAARHTPRQFLAWLLPALAAAWLVVLVRAGLALPFALQVQVNGQAVGFVASEQAFDSARADVLARVNTARALLQDAGHEAPAWDLEPTYTLAVSAQTMTEREIADEILRVSGSEITAGTAVYIDGALRFVTTEGDHLRYYLNAVKAPWQDEAGDAARVEFAHGLRLVDGVYLTDSVVEYADALAALQADDGAALQVQVVQQTEEWQEIPYTTETQEDPSLDFGKSETVQAGVAGSQRLTHELTWIDGTLVDDQIVDVQVEQPPQTEIIRRGTRLKSGMIGKLGTGTFIWPVPGYRQISRWAYLVPGPGFHRGADIAAPYGTPIYAADAGTVIEAVSMHYSWGNYVKIDHGNGYKTLYAHMSSFAVSLGDTVEQGQVIGYVGNTGNSYGNHCHLEMSYNDVLFNARDVFPNMPRINS